MKGNKEKTTTVDLLAQREVSFFLRLHRHLPDRICGGLLFGHCYYRKDGVAINGANDYVDILRKDPEFVKKEREVEIAVGNGVALFEENIMKKVIKEYEKSCQEIADKINEIYFNSKQEICWIADNIGEVCNMGDWFFDMNYMITALKYNATEAQFFDFYDLEIERKNKTNFKNYILFEREL